MWRHTARKEGAQQCRQKSQSYLEYNIRSFKVVWPGWRSIILLQLYQRPVGLGLIGAANAPAEWVREQIRAAKNLTEQPFGVNIMLMCPYADEVAQVVAEEGVKS